MGRWWASVAGHFTQLISGMDVIKTEVVLANGISRHTTNISRLEKLHDPLPAGLAKESARQDIIAALQVQLK